VCKCHIRYELTPAAGVARVSQEMFVVAPYIGIHGQKFCTVASGS